MRLRASFAVIFAAILVAPARGEEAADELLRLTPPDAGVTIAVEDLAGHIRTFWESPLAEGLARLPAVRAWISSDAGRRFLRSRKEIEGALKVDAADLRDALFGQAFVLALQLPPGEPPDRARGLLLTKVRDKALLQRLISTINDAERKDGALVEVATRDRGGTSYSVRTFRAGTKPPEAYAILGDTFAWSNSEALIREVIDRTAQGPGLGALPGFRKVRDGLPPRSAASLFVDPRFVERMLAADAKPHSREEERNLAFLRRYLSPLEYAGACLQWRDGLILHAREAIDPDKLDTALKLRKSLVRAEGAPSRRAPATVLALATGPVDFAAIFDGLISLVPEAERPHADHVAAVVRGVLLGKDARSEILPRLGPGVLLYLDAPGASETWPPWVVSVDVDDVGTSAAIENGLRTALSLYALGQKGKEATLRVETREIGGVRVTGLTGTRFAYAFGRGRLACSATPEAAAGGIDAGGGGAQGDSRFERARSAFFPGVESFAYADLEAIWKVADSRRDALAQGLAAGRPKDARRDLDHVLDFLHLFRFAFATSAVDPGYTATHRTLGLITRGAGEGPAAP